jgi:hypothetical protein
MIEFVAFIGLEITDPTSGMDPGPPQHLVGQHVAQTGYDTLIHEDRLDRRAASIQALLQAGPGQAQRVGALLPDHAPNAVFVVRQPQTAEFALITKDEHPAPDPHDQPVETKTFGGRLLP